MKHLNTQIICLFIISLIILIPFKKVNANSNFDYFIVKDVDSLIEMITNDVNRKRVKQVTLEMNGWTVNGFFYTNTMWMNGTYCDKTFFKGEFNVYAFIDSDLTLTGNDAKRWDFLNYLFLKIKSNDKSIDGISNSILKTCN